MDEDGTAGPWVVTALVVGATLLVGATLAGASGVATSGTAGDRQQLQGGLSIPGGAGEANASVANVSDGLWADAIGSASLPDIDGPDLDSLNQIGQSVENGLREQGLIGGEKGDTSDGPTPGFWLAVSLAVLLFFAVAGPGRG